MFKAERSRVTSRKRMRGNSCKDFKRFSWRTSISFHKISAGHAQGSLFIMQLQIMQRGMQSGHLSDQKN
ncbi:hypothetical protein WJX82_004821 [Trebouxia sp. C0006]